MRAQVRSPSTIMQELRRIRISLGISGQEAASIIGCSANDIHRWETGRNHPRDIAVCELAQALGYELILIRSADVKDRTAS